VGRLSCASFPHISLDNSGVIQDLIGTSLGKEAAAVKNDDPSGKSSHYLEIMLNHQEGETTRIQSINHVDDFLDLRLI
jgi:hypothetical protein